MSYFCIFITVSIVLGLTISCVLFGFSQSTTFHEFELVQWKEHSPRKFSRYAIFSVHVKFQKLLTQWWAGKCLADSWENKAWFVVFPNLHSSTWRQIPPRWPISSFQRSWQMNSPLSPANRSWPRHTTGFAWKWRGGEGNNKVSIRNHERESLGSTWEYLIHFSGKGLSRGQALLCFGFYIPPLPCKVKVHSHLLVSTTLRWLLLDHSLGDCS